MKTSIILLLLYSFSINSIAYENIDKGKRELIDEFIAQLDKGKTAEHFTKTYTNKYFSILKEADPSVDDNVKNIINSEVESYITEQINKKNALNKQLYHIFDKKFSKKELKTIMRFYRTDTGKKIFEMMPELTYEASTLAKIWGQSLEVDVRKKISERLIREDIKITKKE